VATGFPGHDQLSLFEDGGVLIEKGLIRKVGSYSDLSGHTNDVFDHENCILTPALVNCHSHLELSWMANNETIQSSSFDNFVDWIRNLLALRVDEPEADVLQDCISQSQNMMLTSGTGFLLDTGNDPRNQNSIKHNNGPTIFLLEFMGLTGKPQDDALSRLSDLHDDTNSTPHAPYSTGPELLKRLKNRSSQQNSIFSIHTAESQEEIEFLKNGSGPFVDFLAERGLDLSTFDTPKSSPVHYLNKLGLLDSQTLCVHCVQLEENDIDLIADHQVKVCLCPGSNRHLGVGKAPVPEMISRSILPALGTDSLASNTTLSIWQEMRYLREDWPEIDPTIIFSMATYGGNQVVGNDCQYGLLAPNKSGRFLAVETPNSLTREDIFTFLTSVGKDVTLKWVEG